jgi:UPF0271 protein
MPRVDLNIDLGELPEEDPEFYELCTVANIACGGHAGDEASMRRALRSAMGRGVFIAAHPGYPDRENFGRVPMTMVGRDLFRELLTQMGALQSIAREVGATISRVKAHGALYHEIARHLEPAEILIEACLEVFGGGVELTGPPDSMLSSAVRKRNLEYHPEGYADRGYDTDGQILPRGREGALLSGEAAAKQAVTLAESGRFRTISVHGDNPHALETARAVVSALLARDLLRT